MGEKPDILFSFDFPLYKSPFFSIIPFGQVEKCKGNVCSIKTTYPSDKQGCRILPAERRVFSNPLNLIRVIPA